MKLCNIHFNYFRMLKRKYKILPGHYMWFFSLHGRRIKCLLFYLISLTKILHNWNCVLAFNFFNLSKNLLTPPNTFFWGTHFSSSVLKFSPDLKIMGFFFGGGGGRPQICLDFSTFWVNKSVHEKIKNLRC